MSKKRHFDIISQMEESVNNLVKKFILTCLIFLCCSCKVFSSTIIETSVDSTQNMFVLTANETLPELNMKKMVLSSPKRVVYDIDNMVLSNVKAKIEPTLGDVKQFKVAQFSSDTVRLVFQGENINPENIKISIIKNLIVFDVKGAKNHAIRPIYYDKVPTSKDLDYFSYYANLNVISSKDVGRKIVNPPSNSKIVPAVATTQSSVTSSTGAVWNNIKTVNMGSYNIFNIEPFPTGIKLDGVGKIQHANPMILAEPDRFVIDLKNATFKGGQLPQAIGLSPYEKVRFGYQGSNIRVIIDSPNASKYNAIVSPDGMSMSIQRTPNLSPLDFSSVKETKLSKFDITQEGKQLTRIVIKADEPLVHSLVRKPEEIRLNFYNLNTDDSFLEGVVPTKQFKTAEVKPLSNLTHGSSWTIPIKKNSLISSNISVDGKEFELVIKDEMYKSRDIVVKSGATVMIDPGHGGVDTGATRAGCHEKDINLDVAQDLKRYLESKGVNVIMTRDTDVKIPLDERVCMANESGCDAFVSIHVNSAKNPDIQGVETHWLKLDSQKFAKIIHNNLSLGVDTIDRGMFQSQFYVIHHTKMPAVLVEMGFISNPKERNEMIKPQRKYLTAKAIGNGILLYLAMEYENERKNQTAEK